jgi:two-component system sensor histidine kinase PhoQ
MSLSNTTEKSYSLQTRLVLAFGLLLILFLGLAAIVLVRAYRESVVAGVEERLQLQVYALLGVAEPERAGFFLPELREARFSQIDSGLYGFIIGSGGRELWRSPSALNLNLPQDKFLVGEIIPGQTIFGSLETTDQGQLSWVSYSTRWEILNKNYNFVVLESNAPTNAQIRQFTSNLYLWFTALAVFLSVAQYLLLRWGMRPLQKLAADVSAIEAGDQDQLQTNYPNELLPVTQNLNILIKSERDRQGRYRTTLGDLAHSLKTPLAVLSTALQELKQTHNFTEQHALDMAEQLSRMDQIVSYQLKRAVKSNQTKLLSRPVPVAPVLNRILGALNKVYRDKNMAVVCELADNAMFYGEESDLMELCGNLLDNAFKYGASKVQVSASQKKKVLQLEINDDGNGIAESDRNWVLERGARADTVKSGQGIGLAVAVEIVSSYGGEIQIDQNDWGGARIKVRLGH